MPQDQFGAISVPYVTERNVIRPLHPFCFKCRDQIKSKWLAHELYSPQLHSSLVSLFKSSKNGARARKIAFILTEDDVHAMYFAQDGLCALSGEKMTFGPGANTMHTSIDRVDSGKPYVAKNVHLVCRAVNTMKMAMSKDAFLSMCKKIAEHDAKKART